jgi:hypothetical protein
MPVEVATPKMIAATIETKRDADDDQYRDEGLRSAARRKAKKMGGCENP